MITPEPRSIIDGRRPRSRRTAGNRFSLIFCCQISSVTVIKPPLGADDPADVMDNNIDAVKSLQNLVDYFCRAFGGRDICLNKMMVGFFCLAQTAR